MMTSPTLSSEYSEFSGVPQKTASDGSSHGNMIVSHIK